MELPDIIAQESFLVGGDIEIKQHPKFEGSQARVNLNLQFNITEDCEKFPQTT